LLLEPHGAPFVELRWLRSGERLRLWFDSAADWDGLLGFLGALAIDRIHFHHVSGLPEAVLDLPSRLGCAHDLTLHDYYPACPAYHLADASGRYCGMARDCGKCLDAAPAQWPLTIPQWRARFGVVLSTASRVIAPCNDAAERIRAFFPQLSPLVWPHPETEGAPPPAPLRILVPGAISSLKGFEVLRACVEDASKRGLALHFVVLGFLGKPLAQWPQAPLTITGEYPEGTLPALIAKERGDVFFFPSQCPETFSYTLSAALRTGLPIVATDLGAVGERIRGHPGARTVPWDAAASELNDALLSAGGPRAPAAIPSVAFTSFEAYRRAYVAAFAPARAQPSAAEIDIADRWRREPAAAAEQYPPAYLFEDGVVCGKARSLELLRRYVFDPDAVYAATQARFRELLETLWGERAEAAQAAQAAIKAQAEWQAEVERGAARARAAEERVRELEASSSWRLTRPLRRIVTWLRR
jgi:glycosyltransferase involved in cell wall biosynthesis